MNLLDFGDDNAPKVIMPAPAKNTTQNDLLNFDGSSEEEEVSGVQVRQLLSQNPDFLWKNANLTNVPYNPPSTGMLPARKTNETSGFGDLLNFDETQASSSEPINYFGDVISFDTPAET